MTKRITINDLAILMKQGFDAIDLRFVGSEQRFDGLEQRFDGLTHEVALNGDAVAQLIKKFDLESAANQAAHERIEGRLEGVEGRLDKVEMRLDGVQIQLGGVNVRLDRIENNLDLDPLPLPA